MILGISLLMMAGCGDVVADALGDHGETGTDEDSATQTDVDSNSADGTDSATASASLVRVVLDSNTNIELDDQHALAYLLLSGETFTADGMTVNATSDGGGIDVQAQEAQRVVDLCDRTAQIPIHLGAEGNFDTIRGNLDAADFDGKDAVEYIIAKANEPADTPLLFLATGKLTNLALALEKDPGIAGKLRVVWLGTNYPNPGEYNLENDISAANYVLDSDVPFEIVVARYEEATGTDAVRVSLAEIQANMAGRGPTVDTPVVGRYGGEFTNFGDYSVNLFENATWIGPTAALYDMVAVAVVKNPALSEVVEIPAPTYDGAAWQERPDNTRMVSIRENFDRDGIVEAFFATMETFTLIQ